MQIGEKLHQIEFFNGQWCYYRALTVGSVEINDGKERLMCLETGIRSGSVYYAEDHFLSKEAAKDECERRNTIIADGNQKPKIFCFNNGGSPGWYQAIALAEDGECVASHICSHEGYMPHDLGIGSSWKHEKYWRKYPNGFELVWVPTDELKTHSGLNAAIKLSETKEQEK